MITIHCAVSVESMFSQDVGDAVFDRMIDIVYKETSRHLLHVLHTKYKFMEHLKVIVTFVDCVMLQRLEMHIAFQFVGTHLTGMKCHLPYETTHTVLPATWHR